ncbi:hypothetical protein ACIPEQ_13290 [Curtobacterium sp. NPDC087080]|uniref:hypothetical protein n=1 Tax=Curtobacterium sp. NPDC087080 TaxID=3363965 RepID=UPI003819774B
MPDDKPDNDVTLGEVNRNLQAFKADIKADLSELRTGFVSTERFQALERTVQEIKESAKFRVGSWLSVAGIVVSAAVAVWATLRGGGA